MSPVKSKDLSAKSSGKKDKIVVETGDTDELPPGWIKEVKFRKGSASATKFDKFYTDPVTGYIFHSLKDVQRYLKTGVVGKLATKPKERVDVVNEDGKSHIKEKEEMSETWRNKRPLEDASEGYQIRSKSIENGKSDSPQRVSKRPAGIENDSPTPPSPSSELKTRRATRLTTLKTDTPSPSTEPKTRLATRQTTLTTDTPSPSTEPKTRRATRLAGIEIGSPPPSPPDTKSSRQAARKALVKIAAIQSSLESKTQQPTELSYIKIDELETSAPDPKTRHAKRKLGMEINASPASLSEPKTCQAKQLMEMESDASPKLLLEPENLHQTTQSAGMGDNASPESKTQQPTELSNIKIDELAKSAPDPKTRHAKRKLGMEINSSPASLSEPKTCQAKQLMEMEIDASPKLLLEPENLHQTTQLAGMGDNASPLSMPERLTRKSTRLAGSKIGSPPPSQPNTKTSRQATTRRVNLATSKKKEGERNTKKHAENTDMDDKRNPSQESSVISHPIVQETHKQESHTVLPPPTSQESSVISHPIVQETHKKQESHTVLPPPNSQEQYKEVKNRHAVLPPTSQITPEAQPLPTVVPVPPVNLEKQKSTVVSQPAIPQNTDSSTNFSLNDLWTDPCIEFAVKTLTGAIPINDLKKPDNFTTSPLQAPMHDIWTDPCIEFAVKTLTGAIPVADNLQFHPQPLPIASSSNPPTLHDFSLPDVGMNFCQTDVYSKQQETLVPIVGNGGLQKSGNVVNGNNGQCSRSRFFQ